MTNKEAISNLEDMKSYITSQAQLDSINLAIKALEERPTGEWIENYDSQDGFSWLTCSLCMTKAYEGYNYCPNCGARMEAENEVN